MAVTRQMIEEAFSGKRTSFIFTCNGMVQLSQQAHGLGMLVALTREAANAMAAIFSKKKGVPVAVAEVGTVQGETLAGQFAVAVVDQGAVGAYFTDDGKTLIFVSPPAH